MRERFPTWEALAAARPADLAAAIKPGGLSNVKAPRILAILREIADLDRVAHVGGVGDERGDQVLVAVAGDRL